MNLENGAGPAAARSTNGASNLHRIVAQMHDRPNTLERVVGLLRQRGYTIDTLNWNLGEEPGTRRLELIVEADRVDLLARRLERLIDTIGIEEQEPAAI